MRALLLPLAFVASTLVLSNTGRAQVPSDSPTASAPADSPAPAPAGTPSASPHDANVQRHLDFLTKRLDLTPDQQTRITPLLRQEASEAAPIYAQTGISAENREIARIRKQTVEQILPILTPEQRETLMKTLRGKYLD